MEREKNKKINAENADSSKTVCSIKSGAIFPALMSSTAVQKCIRCADSAVWEQFVNVERLFHSTNILESLEFCAVARPGPRLINPECVDRDGLGMMDSEFVHISTQRLKLQKQKSDFKEK